MFLYFHFFSAVRTVTSFVVIPVVFEFKRAYGVYKLGRVPLAFIQGQGCPRDGESNNNGVRRKNSKDLIQQICD